MSKKYKIIILNVALAGLAALSGALVTGASFAEALTAATGYGVVRALIGALVSELTKLRDVTDLATGHRTPPENGLEANTEENRGYPEPDGDSPRYPLD